MINDSPNFHSYCEACRMMVYMKIKLQILIAKPIMLKWLCLMDFKLRRKFAKSDCYR